MSSSMWHEIWSANLYKLSDREVEVWDEEIEDRIDNATSGEVISAVRDVCDRVRKGDITRRKATANDIISAIIKGRFVDKVQGDFTRQSSFVDDLKTEIIRANDHETRWNILCDPMNYTRWATRSTTIDECKHIEEWVRERWSDFERPDFVYEPEDYKKHLNQLYHDGKGRKVFKDNPERLDLIEKH